MRTIFCLWSFMLNMVLICQAQDDAVSTGVAAFRVSSSRTQQQLFLRSTLLIQPPARTSDSALGRTLWRPFDPSTIVVQVFAGGGLVAAIAIPTSSLAERGRDIGSALTYIGGSILATVVVPLGVYAVGGMMGGNGSYGSTLIGMLAGGGIALLPAIISGRGSGKDLFPVAVIVSVVGGIAGYHFSASTVYPTDTGTNQKQQQGPFACGYRVSVISIRL